MPFSEQIEKENEIFQLKRVVNFLLGKEGTEKPITQEEIDKAKAEMITSKETGDTKKDIPCFPQYFTKGEIRVSRPSCIDDCKFLLDKLKEGKTIIVDFSETESRMASNIYYYLLGACYSLDGHVKKISSNLCIFTGKETIVVTSI